MTSILPFFQALLALSFLILLVIISRLYRGIRIVNARLDILSTLVKNLRKEIELTSGIDEVIYEEFDVVDAELQSKLKGDFAMRKHPSMELKAHSGRALVRSSIDLDAIPKNAKGDIESYEAKESGLQVDVKHDMSYIATSPFAAAKESIHLPEEVQAHFPEQETEETSNEEGKD